jgi:hypothetical protein
MHRKEWCLDDYIITDKLYKGYASMGEKQAAAGVFTAAAHAAPSPPQTSSSFTCTAS